MTPMSRICPEGIDASNGTSGLSRFLFNDLGRPDQSLPRSFILESARWEWRPQRRGAIRRIRVILLHPFPPFVCGASPVASGIYDEGVFGCFGIGG